MSITELWAFWPYQGFPGFLSGKVKHFDPKDNAYAAVEGCGHYSVKYFLILPGARGEQLHKLQLAFRNEYTTQLKIVQKTIENAAHDELTTAGFDIPMMRGWHIAGDTGAQAILESCHRIRERVQ